MLYHTASLEDGVAPARPVLDCRIKHGACCINAVTGVQQSLSSAASLSQPEKRTKGERHDVGLE